jgi:hypothetical protein
MFNIGENFEKKDFRTVDYTDDDLVNILKNLIAEYELAAGQEGRGKWLARGRIMHIAGELLIRWAPEHPNQSQLGRLVSMVTDAARDIFILYEMREHKKPAQAAKLRKDELLLPAIVLKKVVDDVAGHVTESHPGAVEQFEEIMGGV